MGAINLLLLCRHGFGPRVTFQKLAERESPGSPWFRMPVQTMRMSLSLRGCFGHNASVRILPVLQNFQHMLDRPLWLGCW